MSPITEIVAIRPQTESERDLLWHRTLAHMDAPFTDDRPAEFPAIVAIEAATPTEGGGGDSVDPAMASTSVACSSDVIDGQPADEPPPSSTHVTPPGGVGRFPAVVGGSAAADGSGCPPTDP